MRLSVASSALAAAFVLAPVAAGYAPALCQDFSITNQVAPAIAGHPDLMRQLQAWRDAHAYYPRHASNSDAPSGCTPPSVTARQWHSKLQWRISPRYRNHPNPQPLHESGTASVFVLVELDQAGLQDRGCPSMETIEAAGIVNQTGTFSLEHVPHRVVLALRVRMITGVSNALVQQPGVHLNERRKPKPRLEESLANHANLFLDLALLPT